LGARVHLAVLALVAMSMIAGTASAGSSYFFCSLMGEQRDEPCCSKSQASSSQVDDADCGCCHRITVAMLPNARLATPARIAHAPASATLPARAISTSRSAVAEERIRISPPRSWPPPRVERTKLMVFLV
jgi:hypothetical protein